MTKNVGEGRRLPPSPSQDIWTGGGALSGYPPLKIEPSFSLVSQNLLPTGHFSDLLSSEKLHASGHTVCKLIQEWSLISKEIISLG